MSNIMFIDQLSNIALKIIPILIIVIIALFIMLVVEGLKFSKAAMFTASKVEVVQQKAIKIQTTINQTAANVEELTSSPAIVHALQAHFAISMFLKIKNNKQVQKILNKRKQK